jgi:hypothetical protein
VSSERIIRADRGRYQHEPDAPPSCPGCGRPFADVFRPDPTRPDALLGVCDNPACSEWVVLTARDGRLIPAERIPRERIRARQPARPAAIAAAAG